MTFQASYQIIFYLLAVFLVAKPLGHYMADIYMGKLPGLTRFFAPLERFCYRMTGIDTEREMDWQCYLRAMLIFNFLGLAVVYLLQRTQGFLPLNPQHFPGIRADTAFNTAASFITNTNWQSYSGETTMSYLSQMLGLTVQNFLSAATGLALLVAVIRGFTRQKTRFLGNFWVDIVRSILYILLPLSMILAVALGSQGVIQNFKGYVDTQPLDPVTYTPAAHAPPQIAKVVTLPMGPVASQVAIKQLGTNGGGFFNTNAAHPYENPTPISNFLEMLAILLIPVAAVFMFGTMVNDKRQGWALFIAMALLLIPFIFCTLHCEQQANPHLQGMPIDQHAYTLLAPGGNMEGKELRNGITNSALWAIVTTATSNGSVNAMHDSFTPLGGMLPLWMMHLGEVVFGGIGSGLYGMLMLVIITVFIAGLMIGRTPEYLGKKMGLFEMKMAAVAVLVMPLFVLLFTAISVVLPAGNSVVGNPGIHGFSEILYAWTSMVNNNGSAFAGLNANTFFYNMLGGIAMLLGRYWIAIPALAVAGSLATKKYIPHSNGTLPTHTPLFILLLISIIIVLGALTFLPALTLGPVLDHIFLYLHKV